MFGLNGLLETPEGGGPELGEERLDGLEAFGPDEVQAPLCIAADVDESRVPEHLQMLRDGLLADIELGGNLADRSRFVAYQAKHRLSTRLSQRTERFGAHAAILASSQLFSSLDLYNYLLV
jgi:hypothetical protein